MGVPVALASAEAAANIGLAVIEVVEKLNKARTCVIELQNHTEHDLVLVGNAHDHGGFEVPPNQKLPAETAEIFGSQSKSGSVLTGTEGSATYQIGGGDAKVRIRWNVPYAGDNDTEGTGTGGWHGSTSFRVSAIAGVGNDAHMKYELRGTGTIVFGEELEEVDAVTMIQGNYGNNLELVARAGGALHFMWREDKPPWTWHGPHRIADGAAGNPVLIQSRFGKKGNFELVYPDPNAGIQFMWRNNDDKKQWSKPARFGENLGKVDAITMIQSNYGNNLELVARTKDKLHFMWRDDRWHEPFQIADGAAGNPVLIQSRFGKKGNFELVYPDRNAGIQFMWRNNDDKGQWSKPARFGEDLGKVDAVTMIQSNYGNNLELVARTKDKLHFMWRQDKPPWTWHGPHWLATGAVGNLNLTQSRFGKRGNFELVYPYRDKGIRFMWRNNDF